MIANLVLPSGRYAAGSDCFLFANDDVDNGRVLGPHIALAAMIDGLWLRATLSSPKA